MAADEQRLSLRGDFIDELDELIAGHRMLGVNPEQILADLEGAVMALKEELSDA